MARILVVDDAVFMRTRCGKILRDAGHEVFEAGDGAEAIESFGALAPDVVLMDITMPTMDGISALKEIIAKDPGARVIMVSAMGQQSMVMEALKAGAKEFVVKPYQPDQLMAAIQKVLG